MHSAAWARAWGWGLGGLTRGGHGQGPGSGFGLWRLQAGHGAAGPRKTPSVLVRLKEGVCSLTTRCRPSPEGAAPPRQSPSLDPGAPAAGPEGSPPDRQFPCTSELPWELLCTLG